MGAECGNCDAPVSDDGAYCEHCDRAWDDGHEAGRREGLMEAQANDLDVAIRNHAYAKGIEAAAKLCDDGTRTGEFYAKLIASLPAQPQAGVPAKCRYCGGPPDHFDPCHAHTMGEPPDIAAIHKRTMTKFVTAPPAAQPAAPQGGPTADQWERALELLACVCHGVDTGPIVDFLREVRP